ncbi:hypothetical protein [Streptomyces sp. Ru62]|uniref:hypothetical protein n=1 Tax=Streptomyces sp. Ru62 TaxID=2080745 RepID=UPI0021564BB8|nr:hypothetical protein [Streptomyces sp. Ru62]
MYRDLVGWTSPTSTATPGPAQELGNFGSLHVRSGEGTKGSPPRRRTTLSVMPWAVEAVEDYVINARPRYTAATSDRRCG